MPLSLKVEIKLNLIIPTNSFVLYCDIDTKNSSLIIIYNTTIPINIEQCVDIFVKLKP